MKKVTLVGIGMGNIDTLTVGGQKALAEADCIIGGKRLLEAAAPFTGAKQEEIAPEKIQSFIENSSYSSYVVALSGDSGFYSGATKLYHLLESSDLQVIPGISVVSYFAAKLHRPWQNFHLVSGHGLPVAPVSQVTRHKETFFLTDGVFTPAALCQELVAYGYGNLMVHIGERLSYGDEKVQSGKAKDFVDTHCAAPNVVVVDHPEGGEAAVVHGLADDSFIRGQVPMTKEEIRSVVLSKLALKAGDVVYDIGAGTGSVAVEAALQCGEGRVYAAEKSAEGIQLIEENKIKWKTDNLTTVFGRAPECLEELPPPDKVFIGGSSGDLRRILELVTKKNPQLHWVATAVTLETLATLLDLEKDFANAFFQVVQVGVTEYPKRGRYQMAKAQNPIFIVTGRNL